MKERNAISQIIELDGELLHRSGGELVRIDDAGDIAGDKQLLTDFQEGMSRVMTVEGPLKYAELLVRRKLQEAGEFEEPVNVFTHWKKKKGKTTSDVFFTAVPSRLTSYYLGELGQQEDITLVYSMYGALWDIIRREAVTDPVAVVLRHHRFAEVVVGSKHQVYFANRCVAFDTEKEQVDALWETVKSDIETVEAEQRIKVKKIILLNWINADDAPQWPQEWQRRLEKAPQERLQMDTLSQPVSLHLVARRQSAAQSHSPLKDKLFHLSKKWAPAVNFGMALLIVAMVVGLIGMKADAYRLQQHMEEIQQQMGQVRIGFPKESLSDDFDRLLKFVVQLDRHRNTPSYQQIVDDLTQTALKQLALDHLKVEFGPDKVRLEVAGNIDAPFEIAHGGFQKFLNQMTARGYHVEESRFETEINRSQVVLKLSRPVI